MSYPLLPNQLPPRLKKVWFLTDTVSTIFLLLAGGVAFLVSHYFQWFNLYWQWGLIAYFGLIAIGYVVGLLLIPYRYQFQRYALTPDELQFQSGYIFRDTTYVPIQRIQHIETSQGPFLRRHQLMSLTIHTAATSHKIAGLDLNEALAIQAQVAQLVKVGSDDV